MAERRAIGWLAKNGLARYRPIFMVAQISLFIIGCMFWIDTQSGGQAFTAEVWGDLAYSIPASFWAFANMSTSALTAVGLMKPVKNWKAKPLIMFSLEAVQMVVLKIFALSQLL